MYIENNKYINYSSSFSWNSSSFIFAGHRFWTFNLGIGVACEVGIVIIACSVTRFSSKLQMNILEKYCKSNQFYYSHTLHLLSTKSVVFFKKHWEVGYFDLTLTMNFLNSPHCSLSGLVISSVICKQPEIEKLGG